MFKLNNQNIKKTIIKAIIVAVLVMLFSNIALAVDLSAKDKDAIEGGFKFINIAQRVLTQMFYPVLIMIGMLLDGSVIFGNGMEAKLRAIWITVRNLVNIIFVVALIGIAIYNVLGIGDENGTYSIKTMLPKIIIGIIAVNFSFLAMKVALDVINISTVAVFSITTDPAVANFEEDGNIDYRSICYAMYGVENDDKPTEFDARQQLNYSREAGQYVINRTEACKTTKIEKATSIDEIREKVVKCANENGGKTYDEKFEEKNKGRYCKISDDKNDVILAKEGEKLFGSNVKFKAKNAAFLMATNLLKIQDYNKVDLSIDSVGKLTVGAVYSLILYVIYIAAFISLFIVLLARMIVVWLAMAFSPILMLSAIIPVVKENMGEAVKEVTKNLLAPLIMSIGMTVGWIMMNAIKDESTFTDKWGDKVLTQGTVPILAIDGFQSLLVSLGTIAVVWMAVFAGAKGTIASTAVDFIKGGLKRAGTFLASVPFKYVPLVPVKLKDGKETKYSLGTVFAMKDRWISDLDRKQQRSKDDLATRLGINGPMYGSKGMKRINNLASSGDPKANETLMLIKSGGMKTLEKEDFHDEFAKWWKRYGIKAFKNDIAFTNAANAYVKASTKDERIAKGKILYETKTIQGADSNTKNSSYTDKGVVKTLNNDQKAAVKNVNEGKYDKASMDILKAILKAVDDDPSKATGPLKDSLERVQALNKLKYTSANTAYSNKDNIKNEKHANYVPTKKQAEALSDIEKKKINEKIIKNAVGAKGTLSDYIKMLDGMGVEKDRQEYIEGVLRENINDKNATVKTELKTS